MNRSFALIGLSLVLATGSAAAQEIQGGVKGGVTSSGLSNLTNALDFGGPVDIRRRTGLAIGPFVAFPMNDVVALQVETLFVTKGATPTDSSNEVRIELSYVDVPVLLRLTPASRRQFYVLFGPSLNFNISAKTIDVVPTREEQDVKDDVRTKEVGVVFGAGVTLNHFLVEGRYSAGLTDIGDTPRLTAPVRNRAFALVVGVAF